MQGLPELNQPSGQEVPHVWIASRSLLEQLRQSLPEEEQSSGKLLPVVSIVPLILPLELLHQGQGDLDGNGDGDRCESFR